MRNPNTVNIAALRLLATISRMDGSARLAAKSTRKGDLLSIVKEKLTFPACLKPAQGGFLAALLA